MKASLKNQAAGFYIQTIAAIAGLISIVVYFRYASALGIVDKLVVIGMITGILCGIVQLLLNIDVFALLMSVSFSVTLFYFITCGETIGSYMDYINNIVAFGHSELIGHINLVIGFVAVSTVLAIVGCFFSTRKGVSETTER